MTIINDKTIVNHFSLISNCCFTLQNPTVILHYGLPDVIFITVFYYCHILVKSFAMLNTNIFDIIRKKGQDSNGGSAFSMTFLVSCP